MLLNESDFFRRHNGSDHLLLNSFRSFGYSKKKKHGSGQDPPNFLLDMCKNCLKTCFYRYRHHSDRFIPVPYASSFHYHDALQLLPWVQTTSKRPILVTYVGGWKTDSASSANLRHIIVNACQKSKHCVAKRLVHVDDALKQYKYHEYRTSTFCLQPPGDDPSRKGVMDSILCGCIPVTFHPDTLLAALPLHLSPAEAAGISVFIPEAMARNTSSFNIISFIQSIAQSDISKKQKNISFLAYRLQYSAPPLHYLRNRSDETTWDPPFPDGVDVMLDGMIGLASVRQSSQALFSHPYNVTSDVAILSEYAYIML